MLIEAAFEQHRLVLAKTKDLPEILERVAVALYICIAGGSRLLVCGNGGSASDAQHFVAELVGRFQNERRPLPAMSLDGGIATLTALANDYGYESVFARQLVAQARYGDLLFAISTSGNSPNVLAAVMAAKVRDLRVVAFTGVSGGGLALHADMLVAVPSTVTARIQEIHILCLHAICERLDDLMKADSERT